MLGNLAAEEMLGAADEIAVSEIKLFLWCSDLTLAHISEFRSATRKIWNAVVSVKVTAAYLQHRHQLWHFEVYRFE